MSSHEHALSVPLQDFNHDASGDESDYDYEPSDGLLNRHRAQEVPTKWEWSKVVEYVPRPGFLGHFFFKTSLGFRIYVAILAIALVALEVGTVLTDRLVFITGVWRFSYPVTMTFGQILATHVLLIISVPLTRSRFALRYPLEWLGLDDLIAPSPGRLLSARSILTLGTSELSLPTTLRVLPLAITMTARLFFSNLSFAYAPLTKYTLAKLPVLPLTFLLTPFVLGPKAVYSKPVVFSSLVSLAGVMLICLHQRTPDATTDTLAYGLGSSVFAALYPLALLRTHALLSETIAASNPSSTLTSAPSPTSRPTNNNNTPDVSPSSSHTTHTLLMHLSTLVLLISTPILFISRELPDISRDCYILDVPKFWTPVIGSFFTSFGVFIITVLVARAAGPIAVVEAGVFRGGFLVLMLEKGGANWVAWVAWLGGVVGFVVAHGGRKWMW